MEKLTVRVGKALERRVTRKKEGTREHGERKAF
jgi:hypothetical protein